MKLARKKSKNSEETQVEKNGLRLDDENRCRKGL